MNINNRFFPLSGDVADSKMWCARKFTVIKPQFIIELWAQSIQEFVNKVMRINI